MNTEIALMIQNVLAWLIFYVLIRLFCRVLGISGNHLVTANLRLCRLKAKNTFLINSINGTEKKITPFAQIRRIKGLIFRAKRIQNNLDVFIFDHRENKHVPMIRSSVADIIQKYKELISEISEEHTVISVEKFEEIQAVMENLEERINAELSEA